MSKEREEVSKEGVCTVTAFGESVQCCISWKPNGSYKFEERSSRRERTGRGREKDKETIGRRWGWGGDMERGREIERERVPEGDNFCKCWKNRATNGPAHQCFV